MVDINASGVFLKHPDKIFIDGEWVAASGDQITVICPNTEQPFAIVAEAVEVDVDAAVKAARDSFDSGVWCNKTPEQRAVVLRKMADILTDRKDELIAAFIGQVGGLCNFAPIAVDGATATFAKYADIAENYGWEERNPSSFPGHDAIVVREAVGVVAAISPWNMPYSIMAQKVAPALASGCSVIMKPPPEAPLEAYIIAEVAEAAGLPAGVLNLLPAHREASDRLVRHPDVDKISFTGSTVAGKHIGAVAAERVARVTLELGGKSPAIVLDDCPTEMAAKILARTITVLTGQVCAMLSRAIVPADRHDEIAEAIAAEMKTVKIGYSTDPTTEMGPIAMERQLERVESYVQIGLDEGARLVHGGKRPEHLETGFFFEPTLFVNVDNSMRIAQEEIFGPVLVLIPAKDLDHAVEIANDSQFGLNSSVLTTDVDAAYAVAKRLRTGNVGQNGLKADFDLPFGGFKQSGIGREGGVEGMSPYVETKVILLETGQ
jgi:acyl-CoA reductase-like NAD-dependent aldehyde dehydrogenase